MFSFLSQNKESVKNCFSYTAGWSWLDAEQSTCHSFMCCKSRPLLPDSQETKTEWQSCELTTRARRLSSQAITIIDLNKLEMGGKSSV